MIESYKQFNKLKLSFHHEVIASILYLYCTLLFKKCQAFIFFSNFSKLPINQVTYFKQAANYKLVGSTPNVAPYCPINQIYSAPSLKTSQVKHTNTKLEWFQDDVLRQIKRLSKQLEYLIF